MYGRVTVRPENVTPDMKVPILDCDGGYGDFQCGSVAETLFKRAVSSGALCAPDGVRIECLADHDIDLGGFVLVASPKRASATSGATTGYHKANVIGTCDSQSTRDRAWVLKALGFFARDLNLAINGLEERSRRPRPRPLARLAVRRVRHRHDPALPSGQALALVVSSASECVDMILQRAVEAPEHEIPGLISALECIVSIDERAPENIVAEARARAEH
jgi:hypothetical protein